MKNFQLWLTACVAVFLLLWAARLPAAVINYVGTQNDLGPNWRTSSVQKPLDIDNDNVLGSDGYDVINLPMVPPGYVSQMNILSGTTGGDPSYASIDNPASLPATFQTGTMNPNPGAGASADLFTFTVNAGVVSRRIRVGLLVDNLDSPVFNAASLSLVQTSGAGAASATLATTSAAFNDQTPDWIFFDIIGAAAGDTFVIRGTGGSSGYATLGGVTFDSTTRVQRLVTNLKDNNGPGNLRVVIGLAAANDLVQFSTNLSGQTILLTNEILLNQNITIDATALPGGIQINGNTNSRIFEVASNITVTLNGLTITNGSGTNGGGIYNSGTLTLNECTVSGNSATNFGGGIYSSGGTLTLNECTLWGNSAINGGGGGIASSLNALTLNQCTVSGNSAHSVGGGISAGGDTVTVYNSIVAGNTGGDFYALSSTSSFTGVNLTNSTPLLAPLGNYGGPTQTMPPLPGSPAIDAGSDSATSLFATDQRGFPRLWGQHVDIGAAEAQFTALVVSNTLDSGPGSLRQTIDQPATNLLFVTFAPGLSGQTILLTSDELLLTNNLTIDATALPGGIQINGSASYRVFEVASNTTVALNGLTITNGYEGKVDNGGGVYNSGTLTLNECTVAGNSSQVGGGIYNALSTLTLNECTVSGNSATTGDGGGIASAGGALTLNECALSGNSTSSDGGGIYDNGHLVNNGGILTNTGGILILNECTLSGNSALANGGGIGIGSITLTVNQSTLSGNSVTNGHGGGIYTGSGAASVYNSIVAGNTADNLYATTGTNTLTGGNFTNGTPLLAPLGNYGGLTQTMPPLFGSPVIDAGSDAATSLFASDQRGFRRLSGLHVDIGAVEAQFTTSVVSNTLDSAAGSLRQTIAQALATLDIATITFAPNLSGQTITLTSGEVLLNNTLTIDASALPQGLQISGNANDRIFEVDSPGPVTLNSLTLTNGSANDGDGGGAVLNYSTLIMNQCTLAGNVAGGNVGGGVENEGTSTLNECTLAGDFAGIGGGLFNDGTLALNQCTVSGNSANSGYGGGGVYNFGNLTLTGSIVAANAATVGADLFNEENLAYSGANLVKSVVNLAPSGSVTGPAPLKGTALLAPLGNYGGPTPTMPPLPGSPAVDAAGTTLFTTDQRGFPRVIGSGPDLGAVEGIYNPTGPGKLTGPTLLANGTFQFGFTNYTDMSFTILATTNLALPPSAWANTGPAVELPTNSGNFQFTDPQATNYPQRFYRVRSP